MASGSANYYLTNPHIHFLGHLSFGVRSYSRSKTYYTQLFAPFGLALVYDDPESKTLGYGFTPDREFFNIFEREEAHPPGVGTHYAFNAPSRKCVREFWEAGTRNGGKSDGAPGVRSDYDDRYYCAFVFDPDGYKLEAVYKGENTDEEEYNEARV